MNAKVHIELEKFGSGYLAIRVISTPPALKLEYQFTDSGVSKIGTLLFDGVIAFRFRDEFRVCGTPTECRGNVAIIYDSDWIPELSKTEPAMFNNSDSCSHFAAKFLHNGYIEVIAESVEKSPNRIGIIKT